MRIILFKEFEAEIKKVCEYLKHLSKLADAVGENRAASVSPTQVENKVDALAKHFVSEQQNLKRFEYNAVIITLYGVFENTISLWVEEFLDGLSSVLPYAKLPSKIQSIHLDLSLALIKQVENDKYLQYKDITKNSVLKNLYDCSINIQPYTLNAKAFTMQTGNLKHEKIRTILNNLNINNFLNVKKHKVSNSEKEQNKKNTAIISALDYFVAERNQIAHGSPPDQLRTPELLKNDIENIQKYGQLVFEALDLQYKKLTDFFNKSKWQKIDFVKKFGADLFGVAVNDLNIVSGDFLLVIYPKKNNAPNVSDFELDSEKLKISDFALLEISSIGLSATDIRESISITTRTEIALKLLQVKRSLKDNQKFYLLKK